MPFCTTCGIHFNGRGSHCTLHNPYIHESRENHAGGYRELAPIRYGTGRFRSSPHHRHHKQYQIGYRGNYDALDIYDPKTALARHENHSQVVPRRLQHDWTNDLASNTHSTNLRPLITTFNHLADTNSIASLTYSVSPTGSHSLTAVANLGREQCLVCLQYFPDRHRLDVHNWEFPVSCETHRMCMRDEDVVWHAHSEKHERCFVKDCGSVYRREGGWRGSIVEKHVKGWHG